MRAFPLTHTVVETGFLIDELDQVLESLVEDEDAKGLVLDDLLDVAAPNVEFDLLPQESEHDVRENRVLHNPKSSALLLSLVDLLQEFIKSLLGRKHQCPFPLRQLRRRVNWAIKLNQIGVVFIPDFQCQDVLYLLLNLISYLNPIGLECDHQPLLFNNRF
jgi:hypothetical protein